MKNQKFIALFLMLMLLVPAFAMAEVTDEQYALSAESCNEHSFSRHFISPPQDT